MNIPSMNRRFSVHLFSVGLPTTPVLLIAWAFIIATPGTLHAGGWLGATISTPRGVEIGEIFKESPADQAGLIKGDRILSFNGTDIYSIGHFMHMLSRSRPGIEVTLTVLRKGEQMSIPVTPDDSRKHTTSRSQTMPRVPNGYGTPYGMGYPRYGGFHPHQNSVPRPPESEQTQMPRSSGRTLMQWPNRYQPKSATATPSTVTGQAPPSTSGQNSATWMDAFPTTRQNQGSRAAAPGSGTPMATFSPRAPWLGVMVGVAENGGLMVRHVADDSPAYRVGVRRGDTLVAYNDRPLKDPSELSQRIAEQSPGMSIKLTLRRRGNTVTVRPRLTLRPQTTQAKPQHVIAETPVVSPPPVSPVPTTESESVPDSPENEK
ncbi:MAG: PDZ domain-containing protein [Magnetococcales bacterium]|nr:PDZ domain-containing protein [Magnetococcales bacterium]